MAYKGVTKPVPAEMVAQMQSAGATIVEAPAVPPPPVTMTYKGVTKDVPAEMVATMEAAGATRNVAGGRARAFANSLSMGLGEDVAGIAARYGTAYGKGDGVLDTVKRVGSEVVDDYVGGVAALASDPLKAVPLMPSPATVGRALGIVDEEQRTPEAEQARAERRAVLKADEDADPMGTDIAAAAGMLAAPAGIPGAGGAVGRGLAAARAAMGRGGAVAQTAKQVATEAAKDAVNAVPGVRVAMKAAAIHETNAAVAPAVERLAGMRKFGVPEAQQVEFLRFLRTKHGAEFMDKVAKLAGVSTKGIK